jgi:hypothetical protein
MPDEQPTTDERATATVTAEHTTEIPSEPIEQDELWPEDAEELPRRPRRRVLTPLPLALLAALAIACGFIAGVLVEKGQGGSASGGGSAGGGFASRLAALRGGSGHGGGTSGSSSGSVSGGSAATNGAAGGFNRTSGSGSTGGGGGATIGQVAFVSKGTLYVTTTEGDTVKVKAAAGASVTKTVKAKVASIHPGETVVVTGTTAASGAVSASAIRVGSTAGGLGGGGLFGAATGGGSGATGSSTGSGAGGSSSVSGATQQLFGNGG